MPSGLEVGELINLFYDLIVNQVFGNVALAGLGTFIIVMAVGVALHLSFDLILVIATVFAVSLVMYGFMPEWIKWLMVIGMGIIVALAFLKLAKIR